MKVWFFFVVVIVGSAQAQLTEKKKHRLDSLYAYAKDTSNDQANRLSAYGQAGFMVYSDLDYGLEVNDSYRDYAKELGEKNHEAVALGYIGYVWMVRGKETEARNAFFEALRLARLNNSKRRECAALADIGNLFEHEGELDSSFLYHSRSLALAIEGNFGSSMYRAKINLGSIFKSKGKYIESQKMLEEALTGCENHKHVGYLASIYIEFGEVNMLIEEFETAEDYFIKAEKIAIALSNFNKVVQSRCMLAELSFVLKDNKKAQEYYKSAYEMAVAENLKINLIEIHRGKAEIYLSERKYQEAKSSIEESIDLIEQNGIGRNSDKTYAVAGEILLEMKELNKSKIYLDIAYKKAKENKHSDVLRKVCLGLYKIAKAQNSPLLALTYYEEYTKLRSIKDDEEAVKSILKSELKRTYEKRNYEDSITKAKKLEEIAFNYKQETEKSNLRTRQAFVWIGVLTLGLIVFFYFWRQKIGLNKELKVKNTEVEQALKDKNVLLKEVHHRVKNNMQIASSILQLRGKNIDNPIAKEVLMESQLRMQSMQLAHQKIHNTADLESVDVTTYSKDLIQLLRRSILPNDCITNVEGEPIFINIEQAQAVGFIVHELITNSAKYAWKEKQGAIELNFNVTGEEVQIDYSDGGIGLPEDFNIQTSESFGTKLIYSLVTRQLMGLIETTNSNGAAFKITFKKR